MEKTLHAELIKLTFVQMIVRLKDDFGYSDDELARKYKQERFWLNVPSYLGGEFTPRQLRDWIALTEQEVLEKGQNCVDDLRYSIGDNQLIAESQIRIWESDSAYGTRILNVLVMEVQKQQRAEEKEKRQVEWEAAKVANEYAEYLRLKVKYE